MTDRDVDPPRHGAAVAGACMGFRVRSTVPLRLLRDDASPGPGPGVIPGAGLAELLVDETEPPRPEPRSAPIATWEPRPDNPFHARLYDDAPDGAWFWTSDAGWYHVEPAAGRVALPIDADPLRREIRLWGVPAAIGLAARGVLSLHAAAVD
ncbi:MAG TPA: hypothetical protein VFI34_10425, partial [Candidatus Limnocylindrales bacterium]|nr:hypothetical protein [Candidatus Limnocylindrales bacterium]